MLEYAREAFGSHYDVPSGKDGNSCQMTIAPIHHHQHDSVCGVENSRPARYIQHLNYWLRLLLAVPSVLESWRPQIRLSTTVAQLSLTYAFQASRKTLKGL